jgi:hypothetical protein
MSQAAAGSKAAGPASEPAGLCLVLVGFRLRLLLLLLLLLPKEILFGFARRCCCCCCRDMYGS